MPVQARLKPGTPGERSEEMGLLDKLFGIGSRADYDGDGKVDPFEAGLFLHEMEEEDRAIATGRGVFGSGRAAVGAEEDYVGLDLEACTILDPDYDGSESFSELIARYGISPTQEDVRFYRETQGFSDDGEDPEDDSGDFDLDDDLDDDFDDL